MFVCYVTLSDNTVPIICEEMVQDEIIDTNLVLVGCKMIEDTILPVLEVTDISVRKSDVLYYVKGVIQEADEKIFDALKISKEKALSEQKANDQLNRYVDETKEIEKIKKETKAKKVVRKPRTKKT